jgi:hypothetical protein
LERDFIVRKRFGEEDVDEHLGSRLEPRRPAEALQRQWAPRFGDDGIDVNRHFLVRQTGRRAGKLAKPIKEEWMRKRRTIRRTPIVVESLDGGADGEGTCNSVVNAELVPLRAGIAVNAFDPSLLLEQLELIRVREPQRVVSANAVERDRESVLARRRYGRANDVRRG